MRRDANLATSPKQMGNQCVSHGQRIGPHLQVQHGLSERRACEVIGADRTSMRYCSLRADDGEIDD